MKHNPVNLILAVVGAILITRSIFRVSRAFIKDYAARRQIAKLTKAERTEILAKSPFEATSFQGDEGMTILLKDAKTLEEAYVVTLVGCSPPQAENWILARWLGYDLSADSLTYLFWREREHE